MTTFNISLNHLLVQTLPLTYHPLLETTTHIANITIAHLAIDSRKVNQGTLFFALQGSGDVTRTLGFIQSAIASGAVAVLTDTLVDVATINNLVPVLYVPDLAKYIGNIAAYYYACCNRTQATPKPALTVAAVTGTNGKTTVSRLLAELLHFNAISSAVMGTTGNGILPHLTPSTHTTLDALNLQHQLYQYQQHGAQVVALEASSHGLEQGRLLGTHIKVALFTNLTRDHLDYHHTFDAYAAAKAQLFDFADLTHAIVNADDPYSAEMIEKLNKGVVLWRYSQQQPAADFYVKAATFTLQGADLTVQTPQGELTLNSPLLGRFNVSNVLAAVAGAMALGLTLSQIKQAVPQLVGAPGRMQVLADAGRLFVVDYAHTPDALAQVLSALRPHVIGRLICVFGCGGNRDTGKRPLMTQLAIQHSDHVIITADNPRFENVDAIIADMLQGVDDTARSYNSNPNPNQSQIQIEPDRRLAIRSAINMSKQGDIVVIAGKGHEDYQEIEGVRHWFDDVAEIKSALLGEAFPVQAIKQQAV